MLCAGVMELADVSDSKSDGSDTVPVRPRSPAPREQVLVSRACFLLVSSFSSVSASPPRALASLPLLESHLRRTETPLRAVRACAERKINRLKRKDLRSACVSKSQTFVSYSVPKRVCCHCGTRHNDDRDLCGTVCRCSNRLRASGTHQYCALTKS